MSTVDRIVGIDNTDKHLKTDNTEDFQEDENLDESEGAVDEGVEDNEDSTDVTDKEASSVSDDGVLAKFKGKTPAEISKAYSELEALHGRLANEVGDYRKMARDWLFSEQQTNSKDNRKATKELSDEDFIDKPSEAVSSIVEERINPVTKRLDKFEQDLLVTEFQRKNPDYLEIVSAPEFIDWVKASPYRTKLYQKADAMDLDAGTELLQGYRETKRASDSNKQARDKEVDKTKTLRKVASEKSGASGSSGKKKIWSSAYLINLKITNPEKYNSIQPEVMEAYREGRVK